MDASVITAWIALAGTLVGGIGLKVVEKWLSKSKEEDDLATTMRQEVRDDLKACRAQLEETEHELDTWRDRYYELLSDTIEKRKYSSDPQDFRKVDESDNP